MFLSVFHPSILCVNLDLFLDVITKEILLNGLYFSLIKKKKSYISNFFYKIVIFISFFLTSLVFLFFPLLCFQTDIEQAIAAMKQSMIVSNKLRKRTSLLGSVSRMATGVNYNEFTEGNMLYMFLFKIYMHCVSIQCIFPYDIFLWSYMYVIFHLINFLVKTVQIYHTRPVDLRSNGFNHCPEN